MSARSGLVALPPPDIGPRKSNAACARDVPAARRLPGPIERAIRSRKGAVSGQGDLCRLRIKTRQAAGFVADLSPIHGAMGLKIANDFRQEQSKYSVRATVALIAALFILFVAVLVSAIYQASQEAQRSAESRADAASQVVATNTRWIVELARQALQRIDDTLGDTFHAVERQAVLNIADAVESLPGSVKAFVVDARGNAIYSTDPSMTPIDVAGQQYFSVPAAGTAWYTSSLLVNGVDGEQTFVFSKRLERDGKFAGVAAVSFNVSQISEIWASLGLDKESTVSIIRDDGQLVARYPLADGPLDLSKYILFTDYLPKSPSGVYRAVSPVDGIARLVGYRKVTGTELVAIASISTTAAYRLFWRDTAWILGLSVPTALALAFASLWIVRLIQSGFRRQAELASALELNRLLFRDTHHRVKNNLQSVQSLVRMQNIPAEVKSDLQGRIAAMTAVHEHMYRLDQYADIDASELHPLHHRAPAKDLWRRPQIRHRHRARRGRSRLRHAAGAAGQRGRHQRAEICISGQEGRHDQGRPPQARRPQGGAGDRR